MDRELAVRTLQSEIETLTRLHIQYGLHNTVGFFRQKKRVEDLVREHEIDLKQELDPLFFNLYRRYFG